MDEDQRYKESLQGAVDEWHNAIAAYRALPNIEKLAQEAMGLLPDQESTPLFDTLRQNVVKTLREHPYISGPKLNTARAVEKRLLEARERLALLLAIEVGYR